MRVIPGDYHSIIASSLSHCTVAANSNRLLTCSLYVARLDRIFPRCKYKARTTTKPCKELFGIHFIRVFVADLNGVSSDAHGLGSPDYRWLSSMFADDNNTLAYPPSACI
jgi:hypothetical protein